MSDGHETADHQTLVRLALADWSEAAVAHVVSVSVVGRRAEVAVVVNGDHEHWTYFQRDEEGWHETVSGNGPTLGWDDPGAVDWGARRHGDAG